MELVSTPLSSKTCRILFGIPPKKSSSTEVFWSAHPRVTPPGVNYCHFQRVVFVNGVIGVLRPFVLYLCVGGCIELCILVEGSSWELVDRRQRHFSQ